MTTACCSVHDDVEGHRGAVFDLQSPGGAVRPPRDRNHVQHAVRNDRSVGQQFGAGRAAAAEDRSRDPGTCQWSPVATYAAADRRRHVGRHAPT